MTSDNESRAGTRRKVETHTLDHTTFGHRLRTARKHFGWTLVQLSEMSGVSVPTISRAERGQLALGYENVAALGRALQMDMNAMFAGKGVRTTPINTPILTRAGQGTMYRGTSFDYEFLGTMASGKRMSPVVGTVHARKIHGPEDFAHHEGEEFVYVLSGELEVHFETGQVEALKRGDSLYYDCRVGHAYISTSRQLARILGVSSVDGESAPIGAEDESRRSAELGGNGKNGSKRR